VNLALKDGWESCGDKYLPIVLLGGVGVAFE